MAQERRVIRWPDDDLAAAHAFADIVIGLAGKIESHATNTERAEALTSAALKTQVDRAWLQAGVAVAVRNLARQAGADRSIAVGDLVPQNNRLPHVEGRRGIL